MYYHVSDWLGTRRMQTDSTGAVDFTCTNLPHGDARNCNGSFNATQQEFDGWEYDQETGLDYAHARYYNNRLYRFMTADPAGLAAVDWSNPQSLNRYAFVGGNPVNYTDPSGAMVQYQRPGQGDFGAGGFLEGYTIDGIDPGAGGWGSPYPANGYAMIAIADSSEDDYPGYLPGLLGSPSMPALLPVAGGAAGGPANNVTCAGKVVQVSPNVLIQSDSNGMITAVGVQLTGPTAYLGMAGGTFVNVPAYTSVGASLGPNGALTVAVSNPVFMKPGGVGALFGAYLSSATFSNGSFSQVNGAVAFEGMAFGSKTTPSGYLLNQFNANSQLVNVAGLLQSTAQVAQQLIGCSVVK